MTALPDDAPEGLLTIDELAVAVGMTVRNTRYYASLGLMPAPIRRGRVAYYDDVHRARLELVRALQQHGFTLQAIEGFVGTIPADATVEQLALQRAMLTSWTPQRQRSSPAASSRSGPAASCRPTTCGCWWCWARCERRGKSYVALPHLEVGLGLLDLDVPEESLNAAGEAIRRHMESLVEELTDILRTFMLQPFREQGEDPAEAERIRETLPRLRQLTLEAVVGGFQQAANAVITRSLAQGLDLGEQRQPGHHDQAEHHHVAENQQHRVLHLQPARDRAEHQADEAD